MSQVIATAGVITGLDAGSKPAPATRVGSPALPIFARHETFAPRFGWLTKGYSAAVQDPMVFLAEDAPFRLGVGKNMARSIRYWCHAFKVLQEQPVPGGRSFASVPSAIGRALLDEQQGWDPYLEDPASLWLLHWLLIASPCSATAWWFAFTAFPQQEFSAERLLASLTEYTVRTYPSARAASSSLRKDVNCLIRMYAESAPTVGVNEDALQCPLADLGLIRQGGDAKSFVFDVGEKPGLPAAVVVKACLDFAVSAVPGAQTISVSRLLLEPGSPGMAFKLTESALCAAIEQVAARTKDIGLADTAGLVQLSFRGAPGPLAYEVLAEFFTARAEAVA